MKVVWQSFKGMTCVIYRDEYAMTCGKSKLTVTFTFTAALIFILTCTTAIVEAENNFNLEITNLTGATFSFTDQQLFDMPKTTVNADLYCEGSLLTSGNWSGVRLSYLLTEIDTAGEVYSVQFEASDGYKANIPYDLAIQPDTIIAYQKDGEPLVEELRLILPGANGAAWISMISSITMSTTGANYPEGVTVGGGSLPKTLPTRPPELAEQTQVTPQPQPTTPANSSNIELESPTNSPVTNQPTPAQQVSKNEDLTLEAGIAVLVLVSIMVLSITTYKVYNSKKSSNSI
jgi:hypothetical protein